MNQNPKSLKGLMSFCIEHSNNVSSSYEDAEKYLIEEGKSPDILKEKLLKKIKAKNLELSALKKMEEFNKLKELQDLAVQKAKELLATSGFSIVNFLREENLVLQNRNLETLNEDEIQNILADYFFLKMKENPDS